MKRGGPLKRNTPLEADPEKARAFIERGRGSLKRSEPAEKDMATSDRVAMRRRVRAQRQAARRAAARRTPRIEWDVKTRASVCAVCGSSLGVTGHHVIPLRMLKANSVDRSLWYDPRNHLALCQEPSPQRCHQRHENYTLRVPRALVLAKAPEAIDFADEVGLLHIFDREYPA